MLKLTSAAVLATAIASTAPAAITGYEVERLEGAVPGTSVVRLYGTLGDPVERAWATGTLDAGVAGIAPAERSLVQLEVDTRRGTATVEALAAFRADGELTLGLGVSGGSPATRPGEADDAFDLEELLEDPFGLSQTSALDTDVWIFDPVLEATFPGASQSIELTVVTDLTSDLDLAAVLGLGDLGANGVIIGGIATIPAAPTWMVAMLAAGGLTRRRRR